MEKLQDNKRQKFEIISQSDKNYSIKPTGQRNNSLIYEENNKSFESYSNSSRSLSNRTSSMSCIIETLEQSKAYIENIDPSSEESLKIQSISMYVGGVKHNSTPFDYIFLDRSVLKLRILIEDAEKEVKSIKKGCFLNIFRCMKANRNNEKHELTQKVISLAKSYFDEKNPLHGNIVMAWYVAVTGRTSFVLEKGIWHLLGFNSEEPKNNGMHLEGLPMVLLHLIYMKENCDLFMHELQSHCLNPNVSCCIVEISSIVLKGTMKIFKSYSFSRYITISNDRPLSLFLTLHTGLMILWCQAFDKIQDKNNIVGILKVAMKSIRDFSQVLSLAKLAENNQI